MVTLIALHTVISMHDILNVMEAGERPHMKPSEYVLLYIVSVAIIYASVGVMMEAYS